MKTLFITDLDGTLLNRNGKLSEYTVNTINQLIKKGMLFTYATARSFNTSSPVTTGLELNLPAITYNGTFIVDTKTGERLVSNTFEREEIFPLIEKLLEKDIYPNVYSLQEQRESFSYIYEKSSKPLLDFISKRKNDPRNNPVSNAADLFKGEIFYITLCDSRNNLLDLFEKYKNRFNCLFYKDIYSNNYFLEITPPSASKAKMALYLKEKYSCERLVIFGDGKNDFEMLSAADLSLAPQNAEKEILDIANIIIKSNDQNGVALWLKDNFNL